MRTIGKDFGDTARKVYAVASGALGNGKTCVVNSDGTVSVIGLGSVDQAIGTPDIFEQANATSFIGSGFDSNSNKVVIAYRDGGNSNYGTAIVGTVDPSDNSISFGTAVVFESANSQHMQVVFDSSNNKIVITYADAGNSEAGTAIVGTISGTSISFGTAVVYTTTTQNGGIHNITTFDSNSNKVVIAYRSQSNSSRGDAIVGTVSGTSISFGSAVTFNSSVTSDIAITFDSNSSKVIIAYESAGGSPANRGYARVGTVSGTSISFGTEVRLHADSTTIEHTIATFDSTNNKVIVGYRDAGNSNLGTFLVGTVSGTDISFGPRRDFDASSVWAKTPSISFDTQAGKFVVGYRDSNNSNYGTLKVGTVSGTNITFGSEVVYEEATTDYFASAYDSFNKKVVISYRDDGNSNYGTAVVFQAAATPTNLTAENYIGITPSAYPTGAGAEIQTKGAVNEEQSGLTAGQSYYVQTDGTLSTTAGDPSVFAGTAVSATKIIVKG
jgi:hypothetical protein